MAETLHFNPLLDPARGLGPYLRVAALWNVGLALSGCLVFQVNLSVHEDCGFFRVFSGSLKHFATGRKKPPSDED